MKISPVGAKRQIETITFYNSFESVPKNGTGKHKAHKVVKRAMNKGDLHTMMLQETNSYCCPRKH
jgi:hypothetical protein